MVGGGAWGTALALQAVRAGQDTVLWARDPSVVNAIAQRHENPRYLPGIALDPALRATGDLVAAAADAGLVLLVTPAQALRSIAGRLSATLRPDRPVVICAKGVEVSTGTLLTAVAAEVLPSGTPLAVLSGPTFAAEVARGLPTAVTVAARQSATADAVIARLGTRSFRPYRSEDPIGVEVCGAVKNVLAIACGMVVGRRLGENARAALMTRGMAELARLSLRLGGRMETAMGLAGLGDLVLTCGSGQSRNFSLGVALGEGVGLVDAIARARGVAEGVATAAALAVLSDRLQVELPICAAVDAILNHGADLDGAMAMLLSRPFRTEGV